MTPLQIAIAYSPDAAAVMLAANHGCSLRTAKKVIKDCLQALDRPVPERLADGALQVAAQQCGAKYVTRPVSDAATAAEALKDVQNPQKLRHESGLELPMPMAPALRDEGRTIFRGQTRANGKPL